VSARKAFDGWTRIPTIFNLRQTIVATPRCWWRKADNRRHGLGESSVVRFCRNSCALFAAGTRPRHTLIRRVDQRLRQTWTLDNERRVCPCYLSILHIQSAAAFQMQFSNGRKTLDVSLLSWLSTTICFKSLISCLP